MASFVRLENNIVTEVVAIDDVDMQDLEGNASEEVGIAYCASLFGGGTWLQTAFVGSRKNHACIGNEYDSVRDAFIPEKPFDSFILNEDTCQWDPPIPEPESKTMEEMYRWDEDTTAWVENV